MRTRWAIFAIVLLCGAGVLATTSFGTAQAPVANALYTDIEIHAKREPHWNAFLKVKGVSDVFVTNHAIIPGGYSGWHSHPGLSIVSVTQGALWLYDGDDPACAPTIVPAGHGFVESGDHVHIVRNEGAGDAKWTTTSIRPAGAAGRIDAANPGNCPF
jgi:quercetin dioxygenase-like cupin family protein